MERTPSPHTAVKISACVITKNEQARLARCLEALSGQVDEIVVVDSFSQDATVEVARCFTNRVYQREFTDFSDQRNHATFLASHDWVLHLDADEVLEEGFWQQVNAFLIQAGSRQAYAAVCFPRKTFDGAGNWLPFMKPRNYPGFLDRLYDRRRAHWVGSVHERLEVQGRRKFIPAHILHYPDHGRRLSEKLAFYEELRHRVPPGYAIERPKGVKRLWSGISQAYFYGNAMLIDLGFWKKGPRYWLFTAQWFAYRLGLRIGGN